MTVLGGRGIVLFLLCLRIWRQLVSLELALSRLPELSGEAVGEPRIGVSFKGLCTIAFSPPCISFSFMSGNLSMEAVRPSRIWGQAAAPSEAGNELYLTWVSGRPSPVKN